MLPNQPITTASWKLTQELQETKAMISMIKNATHIDSCQVSALESVESEVSKAEPMLFSARCISLEQVMCIALRQSDQETAKALLRDVDTTLANQTDGVQKKDVHPVWYKASIQQLRG